jgi:GntR family transcriptional regulator, transcriptional repressor for pyruvate dehydrogenase complex
MHIKPIAAPRLYQHIADEIGRLIDSGEFKLGERLPGERDLAQKFKVSRASLREALSALEIAGRVTIKVGSGVYVRTSSPRRTTAAKPNEDELPPFDVLKARRLVEAETAALAAQHATPPQLKSLSQVFARLSERMREARKLPAEDREFHILIAEASGNGALAKLVRILWEEQYQPLAARIDVLFVTHERRRDNIAEHRAILDAILGRDPAAARAAMKKHIRNAERQRLALVQGQPRE